MANINFGILDTQLPGRIAAIPQEAQKQQTANMLQAMQVQGAMREGQMSQMKIDEMVAERKEIDAFAANLKARGYTQGNRGFFTELASSRNPTRMQQGYEGLRRLDEQDKFAAIMGRTRPAAAPVAAAPSVAPEPGSFGADMAARREADPFASRTNMLPGAAAGVNALAGNAAEIEFKRQQRDDLIGMGTTQSIAAAKAIDADIALLAKEPVYHTVSGVGLVNPRDRSVVMPSVEKPAAPPSMVAEYTFAKTPDGGGFRGSFQDFVTARAAAARPPAQPRPEQPAQPVIDPDTGRQILVSREEAIRRRMTPANTVEKPMTQAQRVTYAKDKVSDKDIVTGALAVTGELEKLTDELVGNPNKNILPAPGLNSITGYSALTNPLALPSGDARKALQKLETFRGKIMALGRQLASQEGKLGNMAVQEWKFVSDAVQKIDPAAGNLDDQMRDVVRQSREYARRQQAKYDDTYADDLTAPPQAAPAAAKPYSVTAPNGKTYPFDTAAQAAAFKKAAGIP